MSLEGKPVKKRSKFAKWSNYAIDFLKYPLMIVLFNFLVLVWVKYKMLDGNLELYLREATPKFY